MKILLVSPPQLREVPIFRIDEGWWMPLGLLSIATYLRTYLPDTNVEILDGEVKSYSEIRQIIQRTDAEIVGFSPNICNYRLTLELAEEAKNRGAVVIFGGHHASALAEAILRKRSFVDFVVRGDGEKAMLEIVKGKKLSEIPNLSYRRGREIVHNSIKWLDLNKLPDIDYRFIDPHPYWVNHKRYYPLSKECPYKKPLVIASQRGCRWRQRSGGCIFCARMEPNWRARDPDRVWQEIIKWEQEWKIDSVADVCDDFLSSLDWFEKFYNSRPLTTKVGLRYIYARPDQLNEKSVKKLKDLKTWTVFLGVESGDEGCLRRCRKGFGPVQQKKAVELLAKDEIYCCLSFVLGLPGENKDSLKKTYKQAEELLRIGKVDLFFVNILNPTPGSRAWRLLLKTEEGKKLAQTDLIDPEEIQQIWVKHFCNISYKELTKAQSEMLSWHSSGIAEYNQA